VRNPGKGFCVKLKVVLQIELEPGKVETFDDVVTTLCHTAGSLGDPTEPLTSSQEGAIFTNQGIEVGIFTVTNDPINDFTNQLA
jgi:hypothetical protein